MNIDDKIQGFLNSVRETEGYIPKFAHNKNPDSKNVYYAGPDFDDNELKAAIKCLLLSEWSVNGSVVAEFEDEFSKLVNQKYSAATNSGSSANLIMFSAAKKHFKWSDGDCLIASCVNFPTTISPIIQSNLGVQFLDIEWNSLNFDITQIESKITPDTKGIVISPVLGNPPDIDALIKIAKKYDLVLFLDACDSTLTSYKGKPIHEYFFASTCSFYPSHELSTISGGMVSSNSFTYITLCRQFTSWARSCWCRSKENLLKNGKCNARFRPWLRNQPDVIVDHKYVYENMGFNLQLLDILAAIGLEQLKKVPILKQKRKLHKNLVQGLFQKYVKDLTFPAVLPEADVSWFASPVICKDYDQKRKLVTYLEENGIQTRNYFAGNLLLHEGFEHLDDFNKYPNANEVLKRVFFVGNSPTWSQYHLDRIEEVLSKYEN